MPLATFHIGTLLNALYVSWHFLAYFFFFSVIYDNTVCFDIFLQTWNTNIPGLSCQNREDTSFWNGLRTSPLLLTQLPLCPPWQRGNTGHHSIGLLVTDLTVSVFLIMDCWACLGNLISDLPPESQISGQKLPDCKIIFLESRCCLFSRGGSRRRRAEQWVWLWFILLSSLHNPCC